MMSSQDGSVSGYVRLPDVRGIVSSERMGWQF